MHFKKPILATGIALALSAAAACGTSNSADSKSSITAVVSGLSFANIDPAGAPVYRKGLMNAIYDSLLRLSDSGEPIPWLAKSFEVSEDGLTWTFELQEGVKFHDGTDFDAEAVKFNLLRQIDPDQHAGEGGSIPHDLTVETPSPTTVLVHLKSPYPALPYALAFMGPGLMASPAAVEKWGDEYGLHPVGTGPFKVDDVVPGQSVRATKWSDYWVDGAPKVDSFTWQVVKSGTAALQAVKSGQAQIMDLAQPLQAHEAAGDSSLQVAVGEGTTSWMLLLNTTAKPFDKVEARRSVASAVDTQSLSSKLFYDVFKPAQSFMGSGMWTYPGTEVDGYPAFDLTAAKQLADSAGGIDFTIKAAGSPDFQAAATAIQSQLAQAGIKARVQPLEQPKLLSDCFSRNFEACLLAVPASPDPESILRTFFDPSTGPNPPGLDDPTLNKLYAEGRSENDPEKRKAVYQRIAQIQAELVPAVFLAQGSPIHVMSSDVEGVVNLPTDSFYLDQATVK